MLKYNIYNIRSWESFVKQPNKTVRTELFIICFAEDRSYFRHFLHDHSQYLAPTVSRDFGYYYADYYDIAGDIRDKLHTVYGSQSSLRKVPEPDGLNIMQH
jgi:hypothetical protein